jgi:DNA-binding MarR family transcriptional regulator
VDATNLRAGGFLISQVHRAARRVFATILRAEAIEISPAQGRILFSLWREEGVPIETLARRTSLTPSTLTRMLDRLEQSGHIRREVSGDDRRKQLIFTTDLDTELRERYDHVSAQMIALFYRGFSERETDRFESDLERILGNLIEAERMGAGRAGGARGIDHYGKDGRDQ